MLKTNSKKARENVRAYIMERENVAEYAEKLLSYLIYREIEKGAKAYKEG